MTLVAAIHSQIDPTWPPTLPNDWILADIRRLFVDDRDHLRVIHMPSSLTPQEIGCVPAPSVLERDAAGEVLWSEPRILRLLALIEHRGIVERILRHLGLPADVPQPRPPRSPPTGALHHDRSGNDTAAVVDVC